MDQSSLESVLFISPYLQGLFSLNLGKIDNDGDGRPHSSFVARLHVCPFNLLPDRAQFPECHVKYMPLFPGRREKVVR